MRLPRASVFGLGLATVLLACGGGGSSKPDGNVVIVDSPPEAPPIDSPPDAPPLDFSCESDTPPTTAPAMVVASGQTQDLDLATQTLKALANVDVKAFKIGVNKDTLLTSTKSDMNGDWMLSLNTTGVPLDGYLEASKTGQRTVRLYPPNPLAIDLTSVPLLVLAESTFGIIVNFIGGTQEAGNGAVALAVLDCANQPISGATISVTQGGTEVGNQHEIAQLMAGAWFVFNVPPGDTIVGATVQGHTLHAHTVKSIADGTTTTIVSPRP